MEFYNSHYYSTLKGHTDLITTLIVLRDGRIVCGSKDGNVIIWK